MTKMIMMTAVGDFDGDDCDDDNNDDVDGDNDEFFRHLGREGVR